MEYLLGFSLVSLIKTAGYAGIFGIIFAESGLLVGLFFPGDSLLFTAGFLASRGFFNLVPLILICFFAAVLGDSFGYFFGKKTGPKIFRKEESFFFHKHHIDKAKIFYERHGGKTIILARFLPVVRTFAPILAGVGVMHYPTFLFYNVVGGALWAIGLPFLGYYLGNAILGVDRFIVPIVIFIVVLSVIPPLYHALRTWKNSKDTVV